MSSKYSQKKQYRETLPQKKTISFQEITQHLKAPSEKYPASLLFELKYLLLSTSTLLSTTIYIHKSYLSNYNIKLILLLTLYFSRRFLSQCYFHFNIKQQLIHSTNHFLLALVLVILSVDIIYIFYDLIVNYTIYSLLPLFYFTLLQIPIFIFDNEKRYQNAHKELIRMIKKAAYFSLEICYYAIFIPIFFAMKNNRFFNSYAICIYILFSLMNSANFIFAFNYYKKSAELFYYTLSTGNWKRISKNELTQEEIAKVKTWVNSQQYEKGVIVEYKENYYIACEEKNFIEPNNIYSKLMSKMFKAPVAVYRKIFFFQIALCMIESSFNVISETNIFSLNLLVSCWYCLIEILIQYQKIKNVFRGRTTY